MNTSILKLTLIATLAVMMFQSGCSDSTKTNTNVAKNSNEQNKNAGVDSATPNTNTASVSNEPAIVISAADLAKEFAKDNFAADKKFGGKKLEVSGVVEIIEILKDPGTLSSVYMGGYKNHMVTCFLPQSETQRVEQFKKGASVTFIGTESGSSLNKQLGERIGKELGERLGGWNVEITDCVFR